MKFIFEWILISMISRNVRSFECVRDVPSTAFLMQENSFTSFYSIDSETSIEAQVFNADKFDSEHTPLLFIHGYTDSRWSFLSTIQCMDIGDRAIIVPSLRGFGDSQIYSQEKSSFSIEEFASDLGVLLEALTVDKAVWIGHSMGSFITHYAAGHMKDKVDSIILLATGSQLDGSLCSDIAVALNTSCPDRDFIDAFQEKDVIASEISTAYANQVVRESYKVDIEPYQMAWDELCEFDSITTASYIASIAVKTTIIWGKADGVTPVDQSFVDMFSSTTPIVETVTGVGHNVQWFAPQEVAEIIKTHIDYVEEDSSSGSSLYHKVEMCIAFVLVRIFCVVCL
eukprot:81398_1